jgi:hypothetical protein
MLVWVSMLVWVNLSVGTSRVPMVQSLEITTFHQRPPGANISVVHVSRSIAAIDTAQHTNGGSLVVEWPSTTVELGTS